MDGDERLAFAPLQEQAFLERVALRLAGRGPDADDVVQEVWLELLERPPRHAHGVRGWLGIAATHALARLRRGERRRQRRERAVARPEAGAGNVVDDVAREHVVGEVASAIGRLDEPYRTVLRLRYIEELSVEEIAARTGRSPGTVRSQAKRGLERVRARLDRTFGSRESWVALLLARPRPAAAPLIAAKTAALAAGIALVAIGTAWLVLGRDLRAAPPFTRTAEGAGTPAGESLAALRAPPPARVALSDPAQARGRLAVHALRAEDRAPLAGEALHVERLGDPVARAQWLETDDDGFAESADLRVGAYRVQARRGEPAIAEVPADGTVELELLLPRGLPVRGTTVDPDRRPIANAEVWLSLPDRPREAWRAAVSDRNGAFVLEADPRTWISARAEDRLLSGALSIGSAWEAAKGAALVEIPLPDAVGRIRATVLDAHGEPVARARVAAYPSRMRVPYHDGRGVARAEGPLDVVSTDAQGRFELPAPDSPLTFLITAPGEPTWFGSLPREEPGVIQLGSPASLAGVVARAGRGPAAGAVVTCLGTFPEDERRVRTGPDGRYRFDGLAGGSWRVSAEVESDPSAGGALAEVELAAGEARELALELGFADVVRGHAVDEDGRPISSCVVTLEPEWLARARETRELVDDPGPRRSLTDAAGSFVFAAVDGGAQRLRLEAPGSVREIAWAVLDGVLPGPQEVALVAPRRPGSGLRGRLEPAPSGVEVFLRGRALARPLRAELENGAFAVSGLAAGTYELVAHRPGNEPFLVRTIELGAGEQSDLGTFALPPAGAAIVRLKSPEAAPLEGVHVVLQSPGGWRYATLEFPVDGITIDPRGELRFADLAPGEHVVVIKSRGFADVFRSLAIRSGEEFVETVDLERGLQVPVRVASASPLASDSELHFELANERGTWRFTLRPSTPWDPAELMRYGLVLPAGEHHLSFQSDCGRGCNVVFDPQELAGRPLALRLE